MRVVSLQDLPPPPEGKVGYPWTAVAPPPCRIVKEIGAACPPISIVTPSFNQGAYIEETIRSVLLQNYPRLDYVVIDGGSTDQTVEVIKKYEPFLTAWVSEPDRGQSEAINKGLARSTGEWWNWLNSDDVLAENALWRLAEVGRQRPAAEAVVGRCQAFSQAGPQFNWTIGLFSSLEATIALGGMAQPSLFYRRERVQELQGVREDLHYCMDLDLWFRYLTNCGQASVRSVGGAPLAYFRLHENSKTVGQDVQFSREHTAILISLLRQSGAGERLLRQLDDLAGWAYDAEWEVSQLTARRLTAYCLEWVMQRYRRELSEGTYFGFYLRSLALQPGGRRLHFYTRPVARWLGHLKRAVSPGAGD